MAVDPALLEILVCPECRTPVRPVKNGTGLRCETCRRVEFFDLDLSLPADD